VKLRLTSEVSGKKVVMVFNQLFRNNRTDDESDEEPAIAAQNSTPHTSTTDEPADVSYRSQQSQRSRTTSRRNSVETSRRRILERVASATFSIITGGLDEDGEMKYLSGRSATCILINFISVGYILLPSGKLKKAP
jgi:hypothetical protein